MIQADENCYDSGINYKFGLSSGSKLLPYLSLGVGSGEASSDKLKKVDDTDVIELHIGFGMHYQVNENIYALFGYAHDTIIFDDRKDNENKNYEFGFASLSSGSKLLPYLSLGVGSGKASSDKLKKVDDTNVIEFDMGLGIHYQVNENIYAMFAYGHDMIIFDDVKDSTNANYEISNTATNTLKVGVSYHF